MLLLSDPLISLGRGPGGAHRPADALPAQGRTLVGGVFHGRPPNAWFPFGGFFFLSPTRKHPRKVTTPERTFFFGSVALENVVKVAHEFLPLSTLSKLHIANGRTHLHFWRNCSTLPWGKSSSHTKVPYLRCARFPVSSNLHRWSGSFVLLPQPFLLGSFLKRRPKNLQY